MMEWKIEQANVIDWATRYEGEPFHAMLTDPPYEIGFMRDWDKTGVAYRPETWAALATHLYPGAFGVAFAASRGWHRLAVAIEDAGLIFHPTIFGWAKGGAFPKATRVPDERFDGHRYGRQAMKGALEPIILFQKPYEGKPAQDIVETGAGALWIDGARIQGEGWTRKGLRDDMRSGGYGANRGKHNGDMPDLAESHPLGRWPSNFTLAHSPECNGSCVPGCPIRELDLQAGICPSGSSTTGEEPAEPMRAVYNGGLGRQAWQSYNDTGGASRFFFNADWMLERLEATSPVFYTGKASSSERDAGLGSPAVTVTDGRTKPIDNPYLRGETLRRNTHPCVKPLSLIRWLAALLLPPVEYAPRRVLVPFSGSGSEMIGAGLAGWEFCHGVELNKSDDGSDYIAIAEARLKHWLERPITVEVQQDGETVTLEQMRLL
jgi:site-specific DNA-methyltransferase (adenine-specific)